MIWVVFALMTGAAVLCALWPLLRRGAGSEGEARSIAFYKAQIAEIDRDVGRGQLPEHEAAGARIEAARRLVAAADRSQAVSGGDARTRRIAAALVILIGVPLTTLVLYARLGSPHEPDEPILARLNDPLGNGDLNAAVAKIEAHLIANPNNGLGYKVVAPAYMRLARYDEAVKAYSEALRRLGDDPDTRADYGEALVAAANGIVTADARAAFQQALAKKPDLPKARYYIALAAEQDGDKTRAADLYQKLLADAPRDASWAPLVRERLAALTAKEPAASAKIDAPPADEAAGIASMSADQQQAAIRGMVARLAARLEEKGDDPQGWRQLIRAYSVLQEADKAKEALAKARAALNGDEAGERDLEALAKELGLES
jgi:cytochrome c-type biogenesis protein CcmH